MKSTQSKLTRLGLSEYEAKAYLALLKESPSTAYEIAKASGVPTSKVYEVVKRLEGRGMIQVIRGEHVKMFVPVSPDEFIGNYRAAIESNLQSLKGELKSFKGMIDEGYIWNIRDYEGLILKAGRMIETAKEKILLSLWPFELTRIENPLKSAEEKGLSIAVLHYGATNIRIGQIHKHPVEDTLYAEKGCRGFALVTDYREVLISRIEGERAEAIWSLNQGIITIVEDYIRHDIYLMKIIKRFDNILKDRFGVKYEMLRDVFKDEDVHK
ncbi:MAG: TrmB family transcriptional regulator [Nitrospirae bacterium]|nr:TrmB family transcriptional regulator [Nitrospirota bacterium]